MPLKHYLKKQTGFSLVEVLVTMMIFSFLAAAVNTVLLVGDASWQANNAHVQLHQELRKAMDWMKDDIRQTGPAAITNVPVNPAIDAVTYPDPDDDPAYDWYTSMTFQKVSGVSGGRITWNSNTTRFVLSGTNLQRIEGTTTRVIAQNIQSLQFRRMNADPDIVEIALDAQQDTFSGAKGITLSADLDFKVQLRN